MSEVSVEAVTSDEPKRPKVVKGDMQCPLLTDPAAVDRREIVETGTDAAGNPMVEAVHRYPEQVINSPSTCPTCSKVVEDHQLSWDMRRGTRDCAIAAKMRGEARYAAMFAKLDAQKGRTDDPALERLTALANRGGVRELSDEKIRAAREAIDLADTEDEKNAARVNLARLYSQGAL